MNEKSMRPTGAMIQVCEEALSEALAETDGMIFALVATADGFDVASASAPGWDISANRLAAMASSGHALGDTTSRELTESSCQNVIIDADRLSIIFMAVPDVDSPPLILGVAATKSASLGNVLYSADRCAKQIGKNATS